MNKPVAWMALNELNGSYTTFTDDQKQRLLPHVSQSYGKWIPLYTHPVKELTDEEILNEWLLTNYNPKTYVWANDTDDNLVLQFAKAILRKASER